MRKLQEECGVTRISLDNLTLLSVLHGPVRFMIHYAPETKPSRGYKTLIVFQDGYTHLASGLASGYLGEGPKGLLEGIQTYLKRNDITIEHISLWRGRTYLILPGSGNGEAIFHLAEWGGAEVW